MAKKVEQINEEFNQDNQDNPGTNQGNEEKNQLDNANLQVQNEKLQDELNQLKTMMAQLMESQKTQNGSLNNASQQKDLNIDDEIELIPPNKLINITSLFYGGMTLTGANNKLIRFEKFGITLPVSFEDLTMICSNHRSLAENGAFFIHNPSAVKSLYLSENYKRFVNKQTIENIITLPEDEIRNIYKNAASEIKDTIIDIVIDGVKQNITTGDMKYSNRGKIELLSELSGKDIYKIANDAVELDQI